jgi:RNA polymerase sigma factor (sigma-70 family)
MADGQCMIMATRSEKRGIDPRSDQHLLRCFARHQEEEAFAALVHRHGSAVWAVCRRVLGDTPEADDAFQATFLVLARKADSEVWHDSVRNWLTAAAQRLALHVRAGEQRRRQREAAVATLPSPEAEWAGPAEDPLREVARRELRHILEEELNGLPEKYRAPMVLCYLEGKTNQEAARQLGWAAGSISRRLARARALLRERPRLRGLAISVGILGSLLALAIALPHAPRSPRDDTVVLVMRQFQGSPHDGLGIEGALRRLETEGADAVKPAELASLSRKVARLLESIRERKSGPWQRQADTARRSALELAWAAETGEPKTVRVAGRKLSAACADCHANYREW